MQASLSRSFRNDFANRWDEFLNDRVKHLIEAGAGVWTDWEVQFMGMVKGDEEVLEKSGIVIERLKSLNMCGKLTLSLLPKFKATDLSPVMDYLLLRGSDMQYHPIVRLNFTGTSLGPKCMRILANTVLDHDKYPWLQWLNLTQCGLSNKPKKKSAAHAESNDDEDQKMQAYGVDMISILAAGLGKNKSLKFLLLNKNPSIDHNGLKALLESVSKHPSLRCLFYNSNRFTINHSTVLSEWLATVPYLPRIQLAHCGIDDAMFAVITRGIAQNHILFELGVQQNNIGDAGLAVFSKNVLMNEKTNIMRLIMYENNITVEGAKFLADALAVNWTITELNLSHQNHGAFGDEAVNVLCQGLKQNGSLFTFRIGHNGLTSDCCRGLGEVLKMHPNLGKLEVFYNPEIGAKGFELLAEGLQFSPRLQLLVLSDTSPGKDGGTALKNALWKQFMNTKKMIKETTQALNRCDAITQCVQESDVDVFSPDLIKVIITEFVGYTLLKQLDLKNCYPQLLEPGVRELADVIQRLQNQGHALQVTW